MNEALQISEKHLSNNSINQREAIENIDVEEEEEMLPPRRSITDPDNAPNVFEAAENPFLMDDGESYAFVTESVDLKLSLKKPEGEPILPTFAESLIPKAKQQTSEFAEQP